MTACVFSVLAAICAVTLGAAAVTLSVSAEADGSFVYANAISYDLEIDGVVSAQASGPDTIGATWYAGDGATSYELQPVLADGTANGAAVIAIASTAQAVTGLTRGTTGFYKLRAVNDAGTTGWGSMVSATTSTDFLANGNLETGDLAPFAIGGALL